MLERLTWPFSPLFTKQDTVLTSKGLRVESGNLDKEGGEREEEGRREERVEEEGEMKWRRIEKRKR